MAEKTYLDHAATAPLRPQAGQRFIDVLREFPANPSSLHEAGARAHQLLEESRRQLQETIGADRLYFTSSATEANNTIILGQLQGGEPGQVIAPATAHASILAPLKIIAQAGRQVELLPVDRQGRIRLDALEEALQKKTRLLCLLQGNNETGTLQPLAEITALVRKKSPRTMIHLDAVQTFGRKQLDLTANQIDTMVASGHKIGAPRGIGILAAQRQATIHPLIHGGGQEEGMRGGTENVAAAAAMALAAQIALNECAKEDERLGKLRSHLIEQLKKRIPDLRINGPAHDCLNHIVSISCPGAPGETVLHFLAEQGIMVGTGSACSGRDQGTSHVLQAMGIPDKAARSTLRLSFGPTTDETALEQVITQLPPIVARLRRLGVDR